MVRDVNIDAIETLDLESGHWDLLLTLPLNYSVIADGHLILCTDNKR